MGKVINIDGLMDLPSPNYEYITSTEKALQALEVIEKSNFVEVDTETTGLDPYIDRVVLLQLGIQGKQFVLDVRDGNVDISIFKNLLENNKYLKLLQNAKFDYKMLKVNYDITLSNVYDTMLAEQLLHLGLFAKANLGYMVAKYLHLNMPKTIATSFSNYDQKYSEKQLRYAANDVAVLKEIYNLQVPIMKKDGLLRVAKLEFDFIAPLAEMELNGVLLDTDKWKVIIAEELEKRDSYKKKLLKELDVSVAQETIFGVSLLNLSSPAQVVKSLNYIGVPVESSDVKELDKYKSNPTVSLLLQYRKHEKFCSTYGEALLNRIHPITNRLHTEFKQLLNTGRLSSSDPNLQNIPHDERYRSCFIARKGYKLVTADMSAAELRIIADMSLEQIWIDIFNSGGDLHTVSAAYVFDVTKEEVIRDKRLPDNDKTKKNYRTNSKPLSFGLCYGLSAHGLAIRLGIPKKAANKMINKYFEKYQMVKKFLDTSGKKAVYNRFSITNSGRRRYFQLPEFGSPTFNKIRGSIERMGKNFPIQGGNADVMKKALILAGERIKIYDARLLLTVHDEMVVEVREDQVNEVAAIIKEAIIEGFAEFFKRVKMECTPQIGDCWMKD